MTTMTNFRVIEFIDGDGIGPNVYSAVQQLNKFLREAGIVARKIHYCPVYSADATAIITCILLEYEIVEIADDDDDDDQKEEEAATK